MYWPLSTADPIKSWEGTGVLKISRKDLKELWLYLSWQSGHFQFERSEVTIQSLAQFNIEHIYNRLLKRHNLREK